MSKALLRYVRLSPTKARLIAREIQGSNAELALASLEFTPNKAAKLISKVIASAVANGGYEAQDVSIISCRIDTGPVLKRFTPRAKGRATPIRKPTSHILVEVGPQKSLKPKNIDKVEKGKSKDSEKNVKTGTKKVATKSKVADSNVKSTDKPKTADSKSKATKSAKSVVKKNVSKKKTEGEER